MYIQFLYIYNLCNLCRLFDLSLSLHFCVYGGKVCQLWNLPPNLTIIDCFFSLFIFSLYFTTHFIFIFVQF